MRINTESLIHEAYKAFNNRDIKAVFKLMSPDVSWPNGWEGGYVNGHAEVENYWTRQWAELNPIITPISINQLTDGRYKVEVHQHVKDLNGQTLFDGTVQHIYTIENGMIKTMEIVK